MTGAVVTQRRQPIAEAQQQVLPHQSPSRQDDSPPAQDRQQYHRSQREARQQKPYRVGATGIGVLGEERLQAVAERGQQHQAEAPGMAIETRNDVQRMH
ncbi:hypothetical protein D9M73_254920 [compost metagenome]